MAARIGPPGTWETSVKTLQRIDDHVWLMPHNPAYHPIPADDADILGKMVALVRPPAPRPGRGRARGGDTPRR